ncbi:hypothetical protein KAR91_47735 [Candidatus Pacearchaeota archaeon]|nr:hypothetical protein [Candidatus Pacearchaeota archaeon]
MAFPSGQTQKTLAVSFEQSRGMAASVKQRSIELKNDSLLGVLSRKNVMEFPTLLADALDAWNKATSITGIGQYAKDQIADQSLNVTVEFSSMVAEAVSVRDWIITNFPNNSGFLLERSFDVNGRMVVGTLTTAQTAGLRVELDKLISSIGD